MAEDCVCTQPICFFLLGQGKQRQRVYPFKLQYRYSLVAGPDLSEGENEERGHLVLSPPGEKETLSPLSFYSLVAKCQVSTPTTTVQRRKEEKEEKSHYIEAVSRVPESFFLFFIPHAQMCVLLRLLHLLLLFLLHSSSSSPHSLVLSLLPCLIK